jgi:hypothetical protein
MEALLFQHSSSNLVRRRSADFETDLLLSNMRHEIAQVGSVPFHAAEHILIPEGFNHAAS